VISPFGAQFDYYTYFKFYHLMGSIKIYHKVVFTKWGAGGYYELPGVNYLVGLLWGAP